MTTDLISPHTIYCILPDVLAANLQEPLREHFRDDPTVEVIDGSLVCDPDAKFVPVPIPPDLPRDVQRFAPLIRFVERIQPA